MDWESAFKVVVGVAAGAASWFFGRQSNAIDQLTQRQNDFEVYVARSHATKDEVKDMMSAITSQLNRIENKLDGKLDKP